MIFKRKTVSMPLLALLLTSMFAMALNAQPAQEEASPLNASAWPSTTQETVNTASETPPSTQSSVDWWPMFRHDENHTGYSSSNVTEPIIMLKSFTTGGKVRSSPAVVNDIVFVGSLDGYVYAWEATPPYALKWKSIKIGAIYSSPTVVEGVVYVGSDDKNIYALNATGGAEVWKYPTGGEVKSSPVVKEGVLYVGSSDGYFYALNALTGSELWKYRTASPIGSSPAVFGDTVVFGTNDGRVYSLDKTGRIEWHFQTNGAVVSSPAIVDGIFLVGSNDTKVYAINATSGAEIWNCSTGGLVTSSPAVAYGMVFVGSDDGYLYALNATSSHLDEGERLKWKNATGGPITSSPAVSGDGKVFVGSCDNRTYAFDVFTGNQIWNYSTGDAVISSPAIANGKVFVGSDDKKVYVFTTENKPPVAIMTHYPENPIIYHTATFDASASYDPDGTITVYQWNFGDGSPLRLTTTPDTTHVYETAGTYNAILTVTDNGGKHNSTSQLIWVLEAWPMFRHDPKHWGNSTSLAPVTNATLWNHTISPVITDLWMYPSPTVIDDKVFIAAHDGTTGTVYAFFTDGELNWSTTPAPGDIIRSTPAVVDDLVWVGSDNGYVYVLNSTNGDIKWTISVFKGTPIHSSPTVVGDKVFFGSHKGHVYAYSKINGTFLNISPDLGGAIYSSPAVAYGRVFVGSSNGSIYALDETTLDVIWNYPTPTKDPLLSSPAVAYGMVFVGSDDGYLYALNSTANSALEMWSYLTGGPIKSSPAVAHGMVFVGSDDGNLYTLNATTKNEEGERIWNKTIGSVRWSSPAVAEGKVFIGTTDGKVYALRVKDGEIWWSHQTASGKPVDSSPAILDDVLYIASKDGKLYAFWEQVYDIAVTRAEPLQTKVAQNQTIYIAVSVENQGSFNKTNINVVAQWDGNLFYNISINLTRGEEQTLQIPWNTTGVDIGNYTICVNATLAPPLTDNDPADNTKCFNVAVELGVHDIKVIDMWSGYNVPEPEHRVKNVTGQNYTVTIYVTIKNEGNFSEYNINVTAYWSNSTHINQTIGSTAIPELPINASITVNITWNTSGFAYGNYTIWGYAEPVPGETDMGDNTFVGGWVFVVGLGDLNADEIVDIFDLVTVALALGSEPGDPNWNPNADSNNDQLIDIFDLVSIAVNIGQAYTYP